MPDVDQDRPIPLTDLQRALLLPLSQGRHDRSSVLQAVVELSEVDRQALGDALRDVAAATDFLRLAFRKDGEAGVVGVVTAKAACDLVFQRVCPSGIDSWLSQDRDRPWVLGERPWRLTVVEGEGHVHLVFSVHPAVADRRTVTRFLRKLLWAAREVVPQPEATEVRLMSGADFTDRPGVADFWTEQLSAVATGDPIQVDDGGASIREGGYVRRSVSLEAGWEEGTSPEAVARAAVAVTLAHYFGGDGRRFGWVVDQRPELGGDAPVDGPAIVSLPVAVDLANCTTLADVIREVETQGEAVGRHSLVSPLHVAGLLPPGEASPLDLTLLVENPGLEFILKADEVLDVEQAWFAEDPPFPVMLYATPSADGVSWTLRCRPGRFTDSSAQAFLDSLVRATAAIVGSSEQDWRSIEVLGDAGRTWYDERAKGPVLETGTTPFWQEFESLARSIPDQVALVARGRAITYGDLNGRVNQAARHLVALGVERGELVGIAVDRSIETVVGMLAVLKAGAAYVPMDPKYPAERLRHMVEDSGCRYVLHSGARPPSISKTGVMFVDLQDPSLEDQDASDLPARTSAQDLAYVIYTSGSTGLPKGVKVTLGNVANFFGGMDERVPSRGPGKTWMAVTSISFDISVLELLWTLCRGFKVVIYDPSIPTAATPVPSGGKTRSGVPLGLFYFAADEGAHGGNPYRLLLDGARFADASGFTGVWTPERHFHEFGGLYPNAAVTGAAVAAITEHVEIRAGSVVLPLHHPVRVAEEWSVVDNLSGGRVSIAFASGWHPNDFILRPQSYANRKAGLFEWADEVQRLWRGETIEYPGPDGSMVPVRVLPRPVQPELPIWVTAAGSPETVRTAGLSGAYLLTHLLGQTVEEVAEKVRLYREARKEGGHEGPGKVALMLHTFVGEDDALVKEQVRSPMISYLQASAGLVKNHLSSWEAFSKKASGAAAAKGTEFSTLSEEEMASLLNFSFERYYETSALLGSKERAADLLSRVFEAGVDEIACLVDFGVGTDMALEALPPLLEVGKGFGDATSRVSEADADAFAALATEHGVTHLQATPSLARVLVRDPENAPAFGQLEAVLLGGEALSTVLASDVKGLTDGELLNMYGPTEATVWASCRTVEGSEPAGTVPIGRPLANTQYRVVNEYGQPVPPGVAGELIIGGGNVTPGYWRRPDLTTERFVSVSGLDGPAYRTGDRVQYLANGELRFLGRIDHQVKIRGHRIELGEIEAAIGAVDGVREVAVCAVGSNDDPRLAAFVAGAGEDPLDLPAIRQQLSGLLPDVMVPTKWTQVPALPKTPNLKVDRKALMAWDGEGESPGAGRDAFAKPTGAAATNGTPENGKRSENGSIADRIRAIWMEELGIDSVKPDDNFFDLGGHSLLVVQVHLRLKEELTRDIAITDLFQFPTVQSLAQHLGEESAPEEDEGQRRAAMRRRMRRGRIGSA